MLEGPSIKWVGWARAPTSTPTSTPTSITLTTGDRHTGATLRPAWLPPAPTRPLCFDSPLLLPPGTPVALTGLASRAELNGSIANVLRWDADAGQYAVHCAATGKGLLVLFDNLAPLGIEPGECEPSHNEPDNEPGQTEEPGHHLAPGHPHLEEPLGTAPGHPAPRHPEPTPPTEMWSVAPLAAGLSASPTSASPTPRLGCGAGLACALGMLLLGIAVGAVSAWSVAAGLGRPCTDPRS